MLKLISDGTAKGTRLLDEDGNNLAAKATRIAVTISADSFVTVDVTYPLVSMDVDCVTSG